MAGGKETTRQKMINIMYLVLLAMLALNVSETILDAFKNINDSLELSKSNVNNSVEQLFASFEGTKLKEEPERARPIYDRAKKAQAIAEDLNNYIESIKKEFLSFLQQKTENITGIFWFMSRKPMIIIYFRFTEINIIRYQNMKKIIWKRLRFLRTEQFTDLGKPFILK